MDRLATHKTLFYQKTSSPAHCPGRIEYSLPATFLELGRQVRGLAVRCLAEEQEHVAMQAGLAGRTWVGKYTYVP